MRVIGYDPNGIPRIFAEDADAIQMLADASAYIKRRPDTGPLSAWRFEEEEEESHE